MAISEAMRNKIKESNAASKAVEQMFADFKKKTGRDLSVSPWMGTLTVIEGKSPFHKKPEGFEDTFKSYPEMEAYFKEELPKAIK